MRRSILRIGTLAAMVSLLATLGLAAPAAASTSSAPGVMVSRDGIEWARELDRPVFADAGVLVPMGEITASFWARNVSRGAATLRVSIAELQTSSADFSDHLVLEVADTVLPGQRVMPIADAERCDIVVPATRVQAGDAVRIDLTLRMTDTDRQVAQQESTRLALTVGMMDAPISDLPPSACTDEGIELPTLPFVDPPSDDAPSRASESNPASAPSAATAASDAPLARTGADLVVTGLAAALALVLAGSITLALRRRRA